MAFTYKTGFPDQQLAGMRHIEDYDDKTDIKLNTFYRISSDKSSNTYKSKQYIKNIVSDIFYINLTQEEDNTLYGVMLDGLNSAKHDMKVNDSDVMFALKGGGACRFYLNLLYNQNFSEKADITNNNFYTESVSDIDVGLVYKSITREYAELVSYEAFNYIRKDRTMSEKIINIFRQKFDKDMPSHVIFKTRYCRGETKENGEFIDNFRTMIGATPTDELIIDDIVLSNREFPDVLIHKAQEHTYMLETYNMTTLTHKDDIQKGVKISYATHIDVCQPALLSYSLIRYKVYLQIIYSLNDEEQLYDVPIEIYDVALPILTKPNFFSTLESYNYYTPIIENNIGLKPISKHKIKDNIIPRKGINKWYDSIYIYSLQYIIDDLIMILIDNPPFPSTDTKYEKRINRLLHMLLINELDKSNKSVVVELFTHLLNTLKLISGINAENIINVTGEPLVIGGYSVGNINIRKKITTFLSIHNLFYQKNTYLYKIIDGFINILILLMYSTAESNNSNLLQYELIYIKNEVIDKELNATYTCDSYKSSIINNSVFISKKFENPDYYKELSLYYNDLRDSFIDIIENNILQLLNKLNN